jgi:Glycosyltransferase family 87
MIGMWPRRIGFIVCLCAVLLWASQIPWSRVLRGYNDFMQLYAGATLAGTSDLYSAEANRTVDERIGFWMPAVQYVRLPFYAGLLKPLAWLPYRAAYLLFQFTCLACLVVFAYFGRLRFRPLPWLLLISVPLLTAFANGQDVVVLLALCAAALSLDEKRRPWLAGMCLALCTIKFHLFVWTPVALLAHRRLRMAAAAGLGVVAELTVSLLMQGRHWPAQYVEFLRNPVIHPNPYVAPGLAGLAGDNFAIELLLGIAVVATLAIACRLTQSFGAAFVLAIYAGLLTAHHVYIQDLLLLLLAPVFIPFPARAGLLLFTPFPYFLLLADRPMALITPAALLLWFVVLSVQVCGRSYIHDAFQPIFPIWDRRKA